MSDTPPDLTPLLARYSYVLLDLDGCIYVGEEAIPGAADAVAALRAHGIGVAFVTNDARRSGEEYVRKLWGLGLKASLEEVVTVGGALQHVLAETERWRTAYVVEALGAPDDDAARKRSREELARLGKLGWVLEHGGVPVSYTTFHARTRGVVYGGGVYTPPAFRRLG